jgi:hypothetical protein
VRLRLLLSTKRNRFLRFNEFLFQGEFKPNFLGLKPLVEQVKIVANVATIGNKIVLRSRLASTSTIFALHGARLQDFSSTQKREIIFSGSQNTVIKEVLL